MNLTLKRNKFQVDGIFGELLAEDGSRIAYTLEHAYPNLGEYAPKLGSGTYICTKGQHRLHGMTEDFTTFEVTGVPGHSGILFHWGNYNADSDGCILLGEKIMAAHPAANHCLMVTNSRVTFQNFMNSMVSEAEFLLNVL